VSHWLRCPSGCGAVGRVGGLVGVPSAHADVCVQDQVLGARMQGTGVLGHHGAALEHDHGRRAQTHLQATVAYRAETE